MSNKDVDTPGLGKLGAEEEDEDEDEKS